MEDKENEPPKKKSRLSLGKSRIHFIRVAHELSEARRGYVLHNTSRSAVSNFYSWLTSLDQEERGKYPQDIVLTDDPELLCSCLCKYVMETRKESGEHYPPKTILNLLSGLLRYMRDNKKEAFNIMDDENPVFIQLHTVLDSFFRVLHNDGVETKPNRSEVISQEEEELLWNKGVMGTDTPQKLLNAIFFYCGLNFCLRGGGH